MKQSGRYTSAKAAGKASKNTAFSDKEILHQIYTLDWMIGYFDGSEDAPIVASALRRRQNEFIDFAEARKLEYE